MEVAVRISPTNDFFSFDSPCSSHYLTAPSSPKQFSISAPTSPSRSSSSFLHESPLGSPSAIPFHWEEKPGLPKSPERTEDFEFTQLFDKASLSADELFHGGKIKPLKPPPGFPVHDNYNLSPRNKVQIDPFEAAFIKETSNEVISSEQRGRDRISYFSSSFIRKATRSVSPDKTVLDAKSPKAKSLVSSSSSFLSSISFSKGNRKWRLKDLFRSASEGRATDKADELRKYASMLRKVEDDAGSSFRSTESAGSRRRGPVSAHEEHYTANRAVREELKKKTFLPYKRGLFGCLRFHRTGLYQISGGVGSLTRG